MMASWAPGVNRNKRKQRWRERKAREYMESLTGIQLAALRASLGRTDEGLPEPLDIGGPGLELWEFVRGKGKEFLNRVRGKR